MKSPTEVLDRNASDHAAMERPGTMGGEPPGSAESREILFIVDDAGLAGRVAQALDGRGFSVSCESNVDRAISACSRGGCCLVLADGAVDRVAFPQVVRHIRHHTPLPLLVISADQELTDQVTLLESGADDCVARPTDCDALIARVRALLRRTERSFAVPRSVHAGNLRLEPGARAATANSQAIECTSTEYDVLEYLARREGQVVSREQLVLAVCGRPASPLDRALDVHISRLRRKLRPVGRRIVTVRSVGYMLATQEHTDPRPPSRHLPAGL